MKKIINTIAIIITVIIIMVVIIASIFNFIWNHKKFFEFSIINALTILIAIVFAYWLVQKNQDNRRFFDSVVKILESIQLIITNKLIIDNFTTTSINNLQQDMRIVRNKIEVLKTVKDKLDIDDEINYIENNFNQYRQTIDNHINDHDYLNKSSTDLNNYKSLLDSKITETIVKIHITNL